MPDIVLLTRGDTRSLAWVLDRMPGGFDPIVVEAAAGAGGTVAAYGARALSGGARGGAAVRLGLLAARTPVVCVMVAHDTHDPQHLRALAVPVLDGDAELVVGVPGQMFAARRERLLAISATAGHDRWLTSPARLAAEAGLSVRTVALGDETATDRPDAPDPAPLASRAL